MENLDDARTACFLYRFLTSSRFFDVLSYGVFRDLTALEEELFFKKTSKRIFPIKIFVKDIFCWAFGKSYIWNRISIKFSKQELIKLQKTLQLERFVSNSLSCYTLRKFLSKTNCRSPCIQICNGLNIHWKINFLNKRNFWNYLNF